MKLPGLPPAGGLICYEAIFPHLGKSDATWLVNVTNDAWFGRSSGPWQHLAAARRWCAPRTPESARLLMKKGALSGAYHLCGKVILIHTL